MPKHDPIERAEQQVDAARERLEAALEAGSDTATARADLDGALVALEAARAAAAQPDAAAPDTTLDEQADAMALEASKRISAQIATLTAIEPPKVEVPVSAARDLLGAQQLSEQAQVALQSWQQRVENLEQRIAETDRKRESILGRRLTGNAEPDDAEQVRLLELDLNGLRDMLERLKLERPIQPGISAAEVAWHRAQAEAEMNARTALIAELQARLIDVATIEPRPPFGQRVRVDPRLRELIQNGTLG